MSDLKADRATQAPSVSTGPAEFDAPDGPPDPGLDVPEIPGLQVNRWVLGAVVVGGLLLTLLVAFITAETNASNRREEFDAAAGQTVQQAIARFEDHRPALELGSAPGR